jgi:hypothetical protein
MTSMRPTPDGYLETTRATAVCPFHANVTIRVGMTPPKAMPMVEPVKLPKVTARHGSGKFCLRKLVANSAMQQMGLALIVRVRILKGRSNLCFFRARKADAKTRPWGFASAPQLKLNAACLAAERLWRPRRPTASTANYAEPHFLRDHVPIGSAQGSLVDVKLNFHLQGDMGESH